MVAPLDIADREHRRVCPACRRPLRVCYCAHVTKVETRTRVVVLQHPRERDMPIGTARMATLCLPRAELHEGVRWDAEALERVLADPWRPPVLLYPGGGAIDVMRHPPRGPVTLVVVDGTWSQAKKIVRENPRLQTLPRYTFTPPAPSEYRIRREPEDAYVSTIEALVHVLGALEGDRDRFAALLQPFRAMIDTQIECERTHRGAGVRHANKRAWTRRPRPNPLRGARAVDLVCVAGEANAWPYRGRVEGTSYADELVHWVGVRVSSGEVFERVVAPSEVIAPRTTSYVELDHDTLRTGCTRHALQSEWRGFARETDVVCFWGHYAPGLFVESGGHLPERRIDLRSAARDFASRKVGTLEEHVAGLALHVPPPRAAGRAGRRLAMLHALVEHFLALGALEHGSAST